MSVFVCYKRYCSTLGSPFCGEKRIIEEICYGRSSWLWSMYSSFDRSCSLWDWRLHLVIRESFTAGARLKERIWRICKGWADGIKRSKNRSGRMFHDFCRICKFRNFVYWYCFIFTGAYQIYHGTKKILESLGLVRIISKWNYIQNIMLKRSWSCYI